MPGFEAALAAARLGAQTLLVSGDPARIGTLACNPSIGGSAKGQLVREIDALGGAMARITDRVSLHARFLNESKGPSVRALRALADKPGYVREPPRDVAAQPNLTVVARHGEDLSSRPVPSRGVVLAGGRSLRAPNVVLATGTFLGRQDLPRRRGSRRGRFGEAARARALAPRWRGWASRSPGSRPAPRRASTAPRSTSRAMAEQRPSADPARLLVRQPAGVCGPAAAVLGGRYERTHAPLVRENLHRSPLYGLDLIRGIGPRYCPSIEDKVVKFAHNPTHQVFVEPEGWDEPTFYVGGFSTSLPADVQLAMLRTLPGFAEVRMLRAGLRRRVRLRAADRTRSERSRRAALPASSTAASSTARAATRRPPRKA